MTFSESDARRMLFSRRACQQIAALIAITCADISGPRVSFSRTTPG